MTATEISQDPSDVGSDAANRLVIARQWITEFVVNPHPELGREGDVCPFMKKAMLQDYVLLRSFDARLGDERMCDFVREMRDTLLAMSEAKVGKLDRSYLTSVMVPYGLEEIEMRHQMERVHTVLKPEFVELGLMLGEFWPGHVGPGLHNKDFRPLSSPLVMLAIRHMVQTDVAFLSQPEIPLQQQLIYLAHYRRVFQGRLSKAWARKLDTVEAEARQALEQAGLEPAPAADGR
jgi:hypothetical protein